MGKTAFSHQCAWYFIGSGVSVGGFPLLVLASRLTQMRVLYDQCATNATL